MSLTETAIGWLAPPQCLTCGVEGATLCDACSILNIIPFGSRCWQCETLTTNGAACAKCRHAGSPGFIWVVTDYKDVAKDLIQKYKFGQERVAANSIADIMAQTFLTYNSDDSIKDHNYLIVPIPTATSRIRERGFDHSALLARHLSKKLGSKSIHALKRIGQTRQVGAKRKQRIEQAQNSYRVVKSGAVTGRNILLIDDVITTGATLQAARAQLRQAGAAKVNALVFAKRR